MGRFHVCMPVTNGDGYCCSLCHRDMSGEMSQYAVEAPGSPWDSPAPSLADRADGVLQGGRTRDVPSDTRRD